MLLQKPLFMALLAPQVKPPLVTQAASVLKITGLVRETFMLYIGPALTVDYMLLLKAA